jgi:hypothetical protein
MTSGSNNESIIKMRHELNIFSKNKTDKKNPFNDEKLETVIQDTNAQSLTAELSVQS